MSDIPSGALTPPGNRGPSVCWPVSSCRDRASRWTSASSTSSKTRPMPGGRTRPPAPPRDRHRIGDLVRDLLQRLPGQLLASLVDASKSVVLRVELTGTARVDVYRSKATGARITVGGAPVSSGDSSEPAAVEFEIDLDAFRGRRLDLVRHHHRHRCSGAQRRLVRPDARAGPGQHRRRHPDLQPAFGLCQRPGRTDLGSVGGRGDQRGHRVRPGHQQGQGPSRFRGRRGRAGQPARRSTTSPTSVAPAATAA